MSEIYPLTSGNMKIQVLLEPSPEGGYTVTVPSLPGCISKGSTKAEALQNITDAMALHLEVADDDLAMHPNAEIHQVAI